MVRILELAPDILGAQKKVSNQPSLATAIHALRLQGMEFRRLPKEYHVVWQHIATGDVTSQETKLLHTTGFGRWTSDTCDNRAEKDIDIYLYNTLKLTKRLRRHRDPLTRIAHFLKRRPQIQDCYRLNGLMKLLNDKYLRELSV